MAGFQIPIAIKIDFLENIVIPFFDEPLVPPKTRNEWMTENAENLYGDHLKALIRSTNFINSFEKAEAERDNERAFFLQQQLAGTLYFNLFIILLSRMSIFLVLFSFSLIICSSSSTTTTPSNHTKSLRNYCHIQSCFRFLW